MIRVVCREACLQAEASRLAEQLGGCLTEPERFEEHERQIREHKKNRQKEMRSDSGSDREHGEHIREHRGHIREHGDIVLLMGREGLSLETEGQSVRGDFAGMLPRIRQNRLGQESLIRAARFRGGRENLVAVDATAGLGEDSFLLAAAGFQVELFERNPVIAALLRDALRRAAETTALSGVVSRMHLTEGDSRSLLRKLPEPPDLILLDPMFPARSKNALSRKKLQLLQKIEGPCDDEAGLLQAAIDARPYRIVVKRPIRGSCLAGRKPDWSVRGRIIRYDCLAFPENREKKENKKNVKQE